MRDNHSASTASSFPLDSIISKCLRPPLNNIYGDVFRSYLDSLKFSMLDPAFIKDHISGAKICSPEKDQQVFFEENPYWFLGDYREYENSVVFLLVNIDSWGWGYHFYYAVYDKTTGKIEYVIKAGFSGEVGDFGSSTNIYWINDKTLLVHSNTVKYDGDGKKYSITTYDSLTVQYKYSGQGFTGKVLEKKIKTDSTAWNNRSE